jgi:hypothetical protein
MSQGADGAAIGLLFDADNRLVGHAKLRWVEDPVTDYSGPLSGVDESTPEISGLVPLGLVAVAAIAAAAGVRVAQHVRDRREAERAELSTRATSSAPPAGWYESANNPTLLRFWDGAAWSNDYARRTSTDPAVAAEWYPDPSNAKRLRYWDGSAWTSHVSPRPGAVTAPPDWYPDPSNAAQLRYWDGTTWTHHVNDNPAASAVVTATSCDVRQAAQDQQPRIHMSRAEWQAHVEAWARAGAIQQELWSRLTNARITDADGPSLESQRRWEELTPQQGAERVRLMLEADPSLRREDVLVEFIRLFGVSEGAPRAAVERRDGGQ